MEISWKWLNLCLGLLLFQFCNGFPINLEDSVADQHTQLLTGLVAVLLTVCSVVLLAGCLCCQRRNGFKEQEKEFRDSPVVASAASNLDHGHVNPIANGEFTIFTPLSTSPYNNNVFLANERIITRTAEDFVYEDFDVTSWFNESEKDFPRTKLKYIKELGKGWFGKVVEGAAREVPPNEQTWTPVVVRILEASASRKERVLFLNDAAIYRCGTHVNVLSLIGRCLDTVPLLLLQEYCPQGDLKNYLRSKKENVEQLLSTDYPLLWCCQLTSGLKHLHNNGVTHPDLATRNCQLTSDLTLKIGDYGLSEQKYPEDYYQGSPRVPVRWCSPESLTCTLTTIQPKKTTTESNIWSLGVTIWEICECGEQPYSSLSDDEVVSQVFGPPNIRLSRPCFAILYTDYLYRLMQLCWTNAESRPAVSQIDLMLSDLWQVYKNTKSNTLSADDFDKRWASFKPNSLAKIDITDNETEDSETNISKPLSPSLNNLHGSLDNLLDSGDQMELWLENVTKSGDLSFAKSNSNVGLSLDDPIVSEMSSSESSDRASPRQKKFKLKSKIDFDLNTKFRDSSIKQPYNFSDSALFSQRTSSESETEDENWRKKVERGAYTEKVRLKSRSVADLMILTHVDYSESESETPLPSLDYRVNYKNVRYAPKNNLENVSLTYGSEGNLLSVHNTFQEELKKLKEERRDSLLFVPDNHSQTSFNKLDNSNHNFSVEELTLSDSNLNNMSVIDSTSKRLMHELNRVAEIQPANQVFNVFNVTIDKFKPIRVNSCKLNDIINFSDIEPSLASEQNGKTEGEKQNVTESPVEESLTQENRRQMDFCDTSEKHISDLITKTYPSGFDENDVQGQSNDADLSQLTNGGIYQAELQSENEKCSVSNDIKSFIRNNEVGIDSFGLKEISNDVPSSESAEKDTVDTINPIFFNDILISELETEFSSSNTESNEASTPGTVVHCRISTDGTKTTNCNDQKLDGDLQTVISSETQVNEEINYNLERDNHEISESKVPADKNINENLIQEAENTYLVPKLSEIIENKNVFCDNYDGQYENLIHGISEPSENEKLLEQSEVPKLSEIITNKIFIDNEILTDENSYQVSFTKMDSNLSNPNIQKNTRRIPESISVEIADTKNCEEANSIELTENDKLPHNDALNLYEKYGIVGNDPDVSNDFEISNGIDELLCEAKNDVLIPKLSEIIKSKGFALNKKPLSELDKHLPDLKQDLDTDFHLLTKVIEQHDISRTNDKSTVAPNCEQEKLENANVVDLTDIIIDINGTSNEEKSLQMPNECEELLCESVKSIQVPKLSEIVKNKFGADEHSTDRSSTYQTDSHNESIVEMSNYLPEQKLQCALAEIESVDDQTNLNEADIGSSTNNSLHECDVNDICVDKASDKESNFQESIIKDSNNPNNAVNVAENLNLDLQEHKNLIDLGDIILVDINEAVTENNVEVPDESDHNEPNAVNMAGSLICESQEIFQNKDIVNFNGIVPVDIKEAEESNLPKGNESNHFEPNGVNSTDNSNYELQNGDIIDLNAIILHVSETPEAVNNFHVPKLSEIILSKRDTYEPTVKDLVPNAGTALTPQVLSEDALNENIVAECLEIGQSDSTDEVGNVGVIERNESHICDKDVLESESERKCTGYSENVSYLKDPEVNQVISDEKGDQEQVVPKGASHLSVFTSTPTFRHNKGYIPPKDTHSNLNLFVTAAEKEESKYSNFYSDLVPLDTSKELNYSLETWDNFLGKTLDAQNDIHNENLFDSFSSEPHSLLFVENGSDLVQPHEYTEAKNVNDNQLACDKQNISSTNNETFVIEAKKENTFVIPDSEKKNETFTLNKSESVESEVEDVADNSTWGSGGGWFLHPQTSNKEPSGTIEVKENTGSYVGFGIDDEIMAAIRNELLNKLPHAQVAPSEKVTEVEEWDSSEKNEVFLKYNIYNPPLSPIIEESYIEDSDIISPSRQESDNEDSEWSEHDIPETLPPEVESQSAHTYDSQMKGPHHRHTPSQDSCCSNDTLFNLEELTCVEKENDLVKNAISESETVVENKLENNESNEVTLEEGCIDIDENIQNTIPGNEINAKSETNNNTKDNNLNNGIILEDTNCNVEETQDTEKKDDVEGEFNLNIEDDQGTSVSEVKSCEGTDYISEFISQEIEHSSIQFYKLSDGSSSEPNSSTEENPIVFKKTQIAPLPSPEDNPWKQLPASLLSYDKVISQNNTLLLPATESNDVVPEFNDLPKDNSITESQCKNVDGLVEECAIKHEENNGNGEDGDVRNTTQSLYENIENEQPDYENIKAREPFYENVKETQPVYENVKDRQPVYQNFNVASDIFNEVDYVNIVNLENSKNNAEYLNEKKDYDAVGCEQDENKIISETSHDEDIYGMLTDIKFNGPSENQLISTSFSESNDINDEQDWDSGSDTRSSSSGEFIWKEGEHEESLKALRAAPQDVLEDIKPMEGIAEESTDESDVSSSTSDEEGEAPEFVPSAWDKFATPTKSALRSPEKTLEKTEKNKSKGVWFKKQKYHCVYEYPREPESPVLQSQDLWKPQLDYSSFTDWEFDADTYFPSAVDDNDIFPSAYNYQPKSISSRNLYQLTSISDFVPSNTGLEDEFFVSSTTRPFDVVGNLSSQFFPGNSTWNGENATPDSGMEDSTPGSSTEMSECNANIKVTNSVQSLKKLASEAAKRSKQMSIKSNDALGGLRHTRNKLKLDLPPSPSAFTSTKMFTVEPILEPMIREKPTFTTFGKSRFSVQHVDTPPDESKNKNVSFEALPYKPMKDEVVQIDSQKEFCPDIDHQNKFQQEKHILQDKFDCVKGHNEFIRGEASLLDSADEDSGIESSTLERKTSNYDLLQ